MCFLCGHVGENVDWYWTVSPQSHRTYEIIHAALTRIREWPDSYDGFLAVQDFTKKVDPIAFAHDDDFPVDCASATRSELRRRTRAHADQLDEAGYSAHTAPTATISPIPPSATRDSGCDDTSDTNWSFVNTVDVIDEQAGTG